MWPVFEVPQKFILWPLFNQFSYWVACMINHFSLLKIPEFGGRAELALWTWQAMGIRGEGDLWRLLS